ncbi:MAG: nicotinamide mononucleotide transporter [Ruminococcaceae bacterium]|nr:nicotinamide mononucleotide transporter [Oscillospiraceae bacterium]
MFDRENLLTLFASIIGVTSLIFNAKGNPFGQILMIIFSFLYGIISFSCFYYGEMITYLGMTMPMAVFALVAWLRNPYKGKKSEVKVNSISVKESLFLLLLTVFVTFVFYFILDYFNTANMFFSTLSVSTSFIAAYLTFRRSPYFALVYAANDVVLIILWIMASFIKISYIGVVICFVVFLINDLYGFVSWLQMEKRQKN